MFQLPKLKSECYPGKEHEWVIVYECPELMVVKCSICLDDKVLYKNLHVVAEKLWGHLKK